MGLPGGVRQALDTMRKEGGLQLNFTESKSWV